MDCTEAAQARDELIGARDIAGDLGAQLFGAAKFSLFAKTLPDSHFHALWRCLQLSVEQVCFDAQRRAVERGAHADIRDRAMAPRRAFKVRARDVNTASGEEFLLRDKVQGRASE